MRVRVLKVGKLISRLGCKTLSVLFGYPSCAESAPSGFQEKVSSGIRGQQAIAVLAHCSFPFDLLLTALRGK